MKRISKLFLIGVIVSVTSQLYLNFMIDGFRLSTAVILFPILVVANSKEVDILKTSILTGVMVFIIRMTISMIRGSDIVASMINIYPGAIFYICYGLILKLLIKNKYVTDYNRLFFYIIICDFVSNIIEVSFRLNFNLLKNDFDFYVILLFIALTRATIAYLILLIIKQYKNLLKKQEHEKRYQNLVLLISDLKSEIYFMQKNIENIETTMSNAYILYEQLSKSDLNNDVKKLSLSITNDIHEVKKDYIRVIKGIETTLTDKLDVEKMSLKDILYILKENTYRIMEDSKNHIHLDFAYKDDFVTKKHFQLMSILSNLVNNSIEAIETANRSGIIKIEQIKDCDNYIFKISDNGIGIEDKDKNYIFNPGFSTKFDYETGAIYRGVGLTNVKTIVHEFFGGEIEVYSNYKIGTEFRVKIPCKSLEVIE